MHSDFHESYWGSQPKPPSERSTGIMFTVVGVTMAMIWRNNTVTSWVALAAASGFAALSIFAASILTPLNLIWFRFGLPLHRIVNPVVMFAMFAHGFVPAGFIVRIWRDPLRSRQITENSSYRIRAGPSEQTPGR